MSYEEDDYKPKPHIIIDNGSGYIKAGFSDEIDPRTVFPSIIGYPKYVNHFNFNREKKEFYIGFEAEANRGILKLNYPIKNYEIDDWINWDDIENIWSYIFTNELRVAPEEHNILITECSENQRKNRNWMAQIMFETFNIPGLYISNPGVLSLYSGGKFTGTAIDLGHSVSQFIPIFDGAPLPYGIKRFNFGGKELTEYFVQILQSYGYKLNTTATWEIAKEIKEKGCYFTLDYEKENKEPFVHELPDGNFITISDTEIRSLKKYFKPKHHEFMRYGFDLYSSGKICYDSIQKCDFDIKKDLFSSIVLSGGNSLFKGLPEIIEKDIKDLAPESLKEKVKVIASSDRKFAAWIGGKLFSQLSSSKSMWITKSEYDESGINIVRRKCFC